MQPDTTAFPLRGREHEPIGRESGTGASGRAAINDPKEKVEEALDDVNQPIRLLGEVALFNFGDDNGDDDDEENLELEGNNGLEAIPEFLRLPIRLFGNWVTTFPILARLFLVSSVVAIGLGVLSQITPNCRVQLDVDFVGKPKGIMPLSPIQIPYYVPCMLLYGVWPEDPIHNRPCNVQFYSALAMYFDCDAP